MDNLEFLPWIIFGAITVGAWAMMSVLSNKKNRADERLDELRDPTIRARALENGENSGNSSDDNAVGSMFKKAAPTLSKALKPKTELEENKLKLQLANAGFNSPSASQIYLAIKFSFLLAGVGIGSSYGLFTYGMTYDSMLALIVCGGVAFYLPGIGLWWMRRKRIENIFLALPDILDLLVVCVEAGLGLDAAMRRVSAELESAYPDLCSEFSFANMQLQMGYTRRDVLHELGIRSGVDDMKSLAAILIQADKFGSSIAKALRVQSDSMRVKRMQMAEERAQQTAVKMIFPLVLFIFPGIFVILVGPAAIMMIQQLLTT
jgi:tight adherence protein C